MKTKQQNYVREYQIIAEIEDRFRYGKIIHRPDGSTGRRKLSRREQMQEMDRLDWLKKLTKNG
jgi:hypothetical protein